jgi:hypothetical protein
MSAEFDRSIGSRQCRATVALKQKEQRGPQGKTEHLPMIDSPKSGLSAISKREDEAFWHSNKYVRFERTIRAQCGRFDERASAGHTLEWREIYSEVCQWQPQVPEAAAAALSDEALLPITRSRPAIFAEPSDFVRTAVMMRTAVSPTLTQVQPNEMNSAAVFLQQMQQSSSACELEYRRRAVICRTILTGTNRRSDLGVKHSLAALVSIICKSCLPTPPHPTRLSIPYFRLTSNRQSTSTAVSPAGRAVCGSVFDFFLDFLQCICRIQHVQTNWIDLFFHA